MSLLRLWKTAAPLVAGGRFFGCLPLVEPGPDDEQDGQHDDDDEAGRILLTGDRIVADDGLDASRGEFADEGRYDVVLHAHGRQGAERIQQYRREIGDHAGDEHDDEAALAAVLVDAGQRLVLRDHAFCCVAEKEAQQQKADSHADGLSHAGQENAPEYAENQRIGGREYDGRREAQRIDEYGEQHREQYGPGAERSDVFGRFLYISAAHQADEVRQEGRIGQVYDDEQQNYGGSGSQLYAQHGARFPGGARHRIIFVQI